MHAGGGRGFSKRGAACAGVHQGFDHFGIGLAHGTASAFFLGVVEFKAIRTGLFYERQQIQGVPIASMMKVVSVGSPRK
jgi:hypothetical protein